MSKPTIAVIFGGASNEHDASLLTAAQVFSNIDTERYQSVLLGIDRSGGWHQVEAVTELADREAQGPSLPDFAGVDLAFPLVHGKNGEDGTLQGLLEMAGVPYVGSGVLASAIGMDKIVANRLFAAAGIPTIPSKVISAVNRGDADLEAQRLGYPVFVKPNQSGTSVGVSRVDEPERLNAALREGFRHDHEVLIQPRIVGSEVEVGVLQDADGSIRISPPLKVRYDESRPFLDYTAKYTEGLAHYEIPAELPEGVYERMRELATTAFTTLRGEGYARVDFFLTEDGELLLNELNTIPGLTEFSHFPRMWAAAGLEMPELVTTLIARGLAARSR